MKSAATTKRATRNPKGKDGKPTSLWPLTPDEVLEGLLKVPPPREEQPDKVSPAGKKAHDER